MALYNMTELYAATTATDLVNFANNATSQFLTPAFCLAVFFVALLVMKRSNDFAEALMGASFVTFIFSLLLRYAGMINFMWVIGYLAILAFTLLYVYMVKD